MQRKAKKSYVFVSSVYNSFNSYVSKQQYKLFKAFSVKSDHAYTSKSPAKWTTHETWITESTTIHQIFHVNINGNMDFPFIFRHESERK